MGPRRRQSRFGTKLKANQEQHHHDAEFRHVHHAASATHQTQQMRTDNDSSEKITEYRTEAQLLCDRHSRNRRQKIDECLEKQSFSFHNALDRFALLLCVESKLPQGTVAGSRL